MTEVYRRKTHILHQELVIEGQPFPKGSVALQSFVDELVDAEVIDLTVYQHFAVSVQSLRSSSMYLIMFNYLEDCDVCYKDLAEIERAETNAEVESIYWDWINENSSLILKITPEDILPVSDHGELTHETYGRVYVRNMVPIDSVNLEI